MMRVFTPNRSVLNCAMVVAVVGMAVATFACGKDSSSPAGPSALQNAAQKAGGSATADVPTLKALAPTPLSPGNGQRFPNTDVTDSNVTVVLSVTNSATPFAAGAPLSYRFEVYDSAGTLKFQSPSLTAGASTTSVSVPLNLEGLQGDQTYTWRARAEYQGAFGPWSAQPSFVEVPPAVVGYIRSNEVYDPLTKGVSVGRINGDVTFVPNVGAQVNDVSSYIEYNLATTVPSGEFSALVTGLRVQSSTEDPKNRVLTMREGTSEINDNLYRMSIDVRGNGAIAWRFLTGPGDYIETVGAERQVYPFRRDQTYFVKGTWGGNSFNVVFQEGGFGGATIYNFGKGYSREYTPDPHNAYVGSPYQGGDRGDPSSYSGMIIRQVWLSARPRPSSINK